MTELEGIKRENVRLRAQIKSPSETQRAIDDLRDALEYLGVEFDPDWGWCSSTAETCHPDPVSAAKAERDAREITSA